MEELLGAIKDITTKPERHLKEQKQKVKLFG
jgi:hypothetical protein